MKEKEKEERKRGVDDGDLPPSVTDAVESEEVPGGGETPEEDSGGKDPEEREIGLLCFQLGTEHYAFHMEDIQEIAHSPSMTRVLSTPPFLKGISSLRGKIVPVLDLKERLNIGAGKHEVTAGKRKKIIIVRGPKGPFGVSVDRISGVTHVPASGLRPAPAHLSAEGARFIKGVVIDGGVLTTVLETSEAFGLTDITGEQERP